MSADTAPNVKMIVAFLLDETGSMQSVRDATISGFNEYIGTLARRQPDALLSLRLFSTEKYATVAQLTPLPVVPPLNYDTYQPNGGTPLYDCIARLIGETESAIASIKPTPDVLMVIMTDGEENSSHEFNRDRIFSLINEKEAKGWTFVYLGANQDAWKVGESIGVKGGRAMTYDATTTGTAGMFRMMSQASDRHFEKRKQVRAMDEYLEEPAPIELNDDFFTDDDAASLGKQKPKDTPDGS